jgi:hypothetical protein
MRRFALPLTGGLFACLLVVSLVLLGRGSSDSQMVNTASSSAGIPAATFVEEPLPSGSSQPAPQPARHLPKCRRSKRRGSAS